MNRIGLLGGTFDPIHYGHLRLAQSALTAFNLDKIIFIPAKTSPFKANKQTTHIKHRLEMLELAINDNPSFTASKLELHREGLSYTIDTLKEIRGLYPYSELYLLMGADSAAGFPMWKDPEGIIKLATVVVCTRNNVIGSEVIAQLPQHYHQRFRCMDSVHITITSSELRRMISAGESVKYLVPDKVENYINVERLYQMEEIF